MLCRMRSPWWLMWIPRTARAISSCWEKRHMPALQMKLAPPFYGETTPCFSMHIDVIISYNFAVRVYQILLPVDRSMKLSKSWRIAWMSSGADFGSHTSKVFTEENRLSLQNGLVGWEQCGAACEVALCLQASGQIRAVLSGSLDSAGGRSSDLDCSAGRNLEDIAQKFSCGNSSSDVDCESWHCPHHHAFVNKTSTLIAIDTCRKPWRASYAAMGIQQLLL